MQRLGAKAVVLGLALAACRGSQIRTGQGGRRRIRRSSWIRTNFRYPGRSADLLRDLEQLRRARERRR